jgi:hypothetical protein
MPANPLIARLEEAGGGSRELDGTQPDRNPQGHRRSGG